MQMLEERVAQQDDELAQMERRVCDTPLTHLAAVESEQIGRATIDMPSYCRHVV